MADAALNVSELKTELGLRGLDAKGSKPQLISRLMAVRSAERR